MSRVAKYPVIIPAGVSVKISSQSLSLEGRLGSLNLAIAPGVSVVHSKEQQLQVAPIENTRKMRCLAGTMRANLSNCVHGVTEGFACTLSLIGVGYRAQLQGSDLVLNVGFSNPHIYSIPEGINIKLPASTEIVIEGVDIQKVNQVAAEIIKIRPPEPYQGKGIRKKGQVIKLKAAKKK